MAEVLYENLKKVSKNGDIVVLDEKNHLLRKGLYFCKEDKAQVDDLSFIPLSDKVLSILTGNPNFTADDSVETDYDEPEADNWDSADDSSQVFPIDEYSDKIDVLEVQKQNVERGEVIQTAVKELQDQEQKQKLEQKSESVENSTENK